MKGVDRKSELSDNCAIFKGCGLEHLIFGFWICLGFWILCLGFVSLLIRASDFEFIDSVGL
jgi:hypothetical protein